MWLPSDCDSVTSNDTVLCRVVLPCISIVLFFIWLFCQHVRLLVLGLLSLCYAGSTIYLQCHSNLVSELFPCAASHISCIVFISIIQNMYFSETFVFERTFTSDEQSDPNIKLFFFLQKLSFWYFFGVCNVVLLLYKKGSTYFMFYSDR